MPAALSRFLAMSLSEMRDSAEKLVVTPLRTFGFRVSLPAHSLVGVIPSGHSPDLLTPTQSTQLC